MSPISQICESLRKDKTIPEHIRVAAERLLRWTSKQIPEGFTALFNGKDLTGWKRHEGLPGEEKPTGKWFVKDGAIVGMQDPPGKGGFLRVGSPNDGLIFQCHPILAESKGKCVFNNKLSMF